MEKKLHQIKDKFDRAYDFNRWFVAGFSHDELQSLFIAKVQEYLFQNVETDYGFDSFEDLYIYSAMNYAVKVQLNEQILKKSAFAAGVNGVTIRAPYLDNDLVDFINSLAVSLRTEGNLKRYISGTSQSKYLHRLIANRLLPVESMKKSKQGGFVPLSIFLNDKIIRSEIFQIIRKSEVLFHIFNKNFIESILSDFEKLPPGKGYWFYYRQFLVSKILHLLALEIWLRQNDHSNLIAPDFDLRAYIP